MNMSREIKDDLLPGLQSRYAHQGCEGRTDELCADYDYERKYAIKLLGGSLPSPTGRQKPGPSAQYGVIEPVVRTSWLAAEQPCGKRLRPALALWLPHYERTMVGCRVGHGSCCGRSVRRRWTGCWRRHGRLTHCGA
jgi:hypothetical protein